VFFPPYFSSVVKIIISFSWVNNRVKEVLVLVDEMQLIPKIVHPIQVIVLEW